MGSIHKLNDRLCRTAKRGRYADGGGLYLIVSGPIGRSWLFRWKVAGKRRELGLGSFRDVPLSMLPARRGQIECRVMIQRRRVRRAGLAR
jgi:hypothetical protein